jgi:hypothetical protein
VVAVRLGVEVLFLAVDSAGVLAWRARSIDLDDASDPDEAAWAIVRSVGGTLSHSTSWRWDGERVVLTYATVLPALADEEFEALPEPAIVGSHDVTHPRPRVVHGHHVAAHAIQHLADLARRDPVVRAASQRAETVDVWRAILAVAGDIPTDSHLRAHREAHAAFADRVHHDPGTREERS